MFLLEDMDKESECVEAIFQSYIVSKRKKDIFLFFEGKDDFKYYAGRISMYISDKEYGVFHCNCKTNVLKVHEMIYTQTDDRNNKRNLYFVDCDYDNNENIPNSIYITSSYSIENYYFTDSAIKKILIGIIGLSEENVDDKTDFDNIFKYMTDNRNKIIDEIIFANAWYSLQIKKSGKNGKFPDMAHIKEYKDIKNVKDISKLEDLVKDSIHITENEMTKEIERIKLNPVSNVRGKYLIQALTPVLRDLLCDAGKKSDRNHFLKKRKIHTNLPDVLGDLSTYADTPIELISYLKEMLS